MKKQLLAVLLLSLLLLVSGCGTLSLADMETQTVGNGDFTLTVPASWSSVEPSGENGVLALTSGDGLELQVIAQLGSMEYYAADELCQMFAERVDEKLFDSNAEWEILGENDKVYSYLLTGSTAAGEAAVCRLDLLMPCPSVHYLLLYTAGADTYDAYSDLTFEILYSFTMSKSAEEMYQQIDAIREQEAQQAAEELRQELDDSVTDENVTDDNVTDDITDDTSDGAFKSDTAPAEDLTDND